MSYEDQLFVSIHMYERVKICRGNVSIIIVANRCGADSVSCTVVAVACVVHMLFYDRFVVPVFVLYE